MTVNEQINTIVNNENAIVEAFEKGDETAIERLIDLRIELLKKLIESPMGDEEKQTVKAFVEQLTEHMKNQIQAMETEREDVRSELVNLKHNFKGTALYKEVRRHR